MSEEERRPRGKGNVYQDLIPAPDVDAHRLPAADHPRKAASAH
jgi:hypothetical protein